MSLITAVLRIQVQYNKKVTHFLTVLVRCWALRFGKTLVSFVSLISLLQIFWPVTIQDIDTPYNSLKRTKRTLALYFISIYSRRERAKKKAHTTQKKISTSHSPLLSSSSSSQEREERQQSLVSCFSLFM